MFLAEDGPLVIIDLLEEKSNGVVRPALELANVLVAGDPAILEAVCLVGVIPAVTRFAAASVSQDIRAQVATFVHHLCHLSTSTLQMFVACQVCPITWFWFPRPAFPSRLLVYFCRFLLVSYKRCFLCSKTSYDLRYVWKKEKGSETP